MNPEDFPKSARVLKSREFRFLQRRGARTHGEYLSVVAKHRRGDGFRVGLTVSKKVGRAHERNLVKRRLREIVRRNKVWFEGYDVVLIAKPDANQMGYRELFADLERAMEKMRASGSQRTASKGTASKGTASKGGKRAK